jgi:hypothetical protein
MDVDLQRHVLSISRDRRNLSKTSSHIVEGEIISTATANQKSVAKEEAARIACERLGIN